MNKKSEPEVIITIKKGRKHAAHHGGAWKVALSDFMTTMFTLFLVLWLVNQSSDVKSAIAGYFQDPLGRASEHGSSIMPGEGAQSQAVRHPASNEDVLSLSRDRLSSMSEKLEKRLAESPEMQELQKHVEISLTNEGLKIELIEDSSGYFFEKGKAAPSAEGRRILALLGAELGELPLPVRIEGHTDAYRYKRVKGYSNWELSADRANATRRILVENGLQESQVVQVRALADRENKPDEDPYSPRNRRVTIMMLFAPMPESPQVSGTIETPTPPPGQQG